MTIYDGIDCTGCTDYAETIDRAEPFGLSDGLARRSREIPMSVVRQSGLRKHLLAGFGLLATAGMTGCQIDVGGQTLPSAHWQKDDVQYFPPGPEFKLSNEAAAMNAYKRDQGLPPGVQQQPVAPGPANPVGPAPMPPAAAPPAAPPAEAAP